MKMETVKGHVVIFDLLQKGFLEILSGSTGLDSYFTGCIATGLRNELWKFKIDFCIFEWQD